MVRARVGSPYVIAAMDDAIIIGSQAVMGFEANRGVMLASDFSLAGGTLSALATRDCVLPILAALHKSAGIEAPLSAVVAQYSLPITLAGRIENYPPEKSSALMAYLRTSKSNIAQFFKQIGRVKATSELDGLRVTLGNGRILHIRPSGTAPELRCYVEASDQDSAEQHMAQSLSPSPIGLPRVFGDRCGKASSQCVPDRAP